MLPGIKSGIYNEISLKKVGEILGRRKPMNILQGVAQPGGDCRILFGVDSRGYRVHHVPANPKLSMHILHMNKLLKSIYAPNIYIRNWHTAIQETVDRDRLGFWYYHLNSPFDNQVHVFKHSGRWSHMTTAV